MSDHRIVEAGTPERPWCAGCGRRIHRNRRGTGWLHDIDSTWVAPSRWEHVTQPAFGGLDDIRVGEWDHRPRPDAFGIACRSCGTRIKRVFGGVGRTTPSTYRRST